mgnify:FL=1
MRVSPDYPLRVQQCVRRAANARAPPQGKHPLQQPSYLLFPDLEAKGWWERDEVISVVEKLEAAFPQIKEECLALIKEMEDVSESSQSALHNQGSCAKRKEGDENQEGKHRDPFVRPSYLVRFLPLLQYSDYHLKSETKGTQMGMLLVVEGRKEDRFPLRGMSCNNSGC